MSANHQLVDALLRLHATATQWLKKSSADEEAAWRDHAKVLESEIVCETDDTKRWDLEASLRALCELIDNPQNRLTDAYASLCFAYGLARLGAYAESASLEAVAAPFFKTDDAAHRRLFRVFTYRIHQAREGGSCRGPLPSELVVQAPNDGQRDIEQRKLAYVFDRLRSWLLILEPAEEVNAFRAWMRTDVDQPIAALYTLRDIKELEERTRELLEKHPDTDTRRKVLRAALELFPRLSPGFGRSVLEITRDYLAELPPVEDHRRRERERRQSVDNLGSLDPYSEVYSAAKAAHDEEFRDLGDLRERASLMEIAARRAADGLDVPLLHSVIGGLVQMIEAQRGDDIFNVLPVLAGRCLQSLQRLQLRTELEQLLSRVTTLIQSQPSFTLDRGGTDNKRIATLRLLLNVAAGWLSLGRLDVSASYINEARNWLLAPIPTRLPIDVAEIACRYIAALALFPVESALNGLYELFPGIGSLCDVFSTNSHFSLLRLRVIDAVVRAVVHLALPEDDGHDYLAVSLN